MRPEYCYTSKDLADEFDVEVTTIRRRMRELGLGLEIGGRAGFRYSEADRKAFIEASLRPTVTPARRRRRSA